MLKLNFEILLDNVWIFQAFQIPIVLSLLILFIITTRSSKKIGFESSKQNNIPKLRWLGLAFFCNLIYLALELNESLKIIELRNLEFIKLLFDVLTSMFLYIAVIKWYYDKTTNAPQIRNVRFFKFRKRILITITVLISALIYVSLVNSKPTTPSSYLNIFLSVYNFFSYFLIGVFLFFATKVQTPPEYKTRINLILMFAFVLWALLQTLIIIPGLETAYINLIGFLSSTIIKILILCGFFYFFFYVARSAIQARNSELKEQAEFLRQLHLRIKDIMQIDKIDTIEQNVVEHLAGVQPFSFDYAIFLRVDNVKGKIYARCSAKGFGVTEDISNWYSNPINLDSRHIFVECVSTSKIQFVDRGTVNGDEIEFDKTNSLLNYEDYFKYDQKRLFKIILPLSIVNSDNNFNVLDSKSYNQAIHESNLNSQVNNNDEKVIGIIEVGFFNPEFSGVEYSEKVKKLKLDYLELYASNVARVYDRFIENDIHQNIKEILADSNRLSEDSFRTYFKSILEKTAAYLEVESASIGIITYDHDDSSEQCQFWEDGNDLINKNDLSYTLPLIEFSSGKVIEKRENIHFDNSLKSKVSVAVRYLDQIVGFSFFVSTREAYLNNNHFKILTNLFVEVGETFIKKKFHLAIAELTQDDNIINETDESIKKIVLVLENYFFTSFVSIWTLEDYNKKEFVQRIGSNALKNLCSEYGNNPVTLPSDDFPFYKPIHFAEESKFNKPFFKFANKNELNLKSLISIPLEIDNHLYGFINVYSRRTIKEIYPEDEKILRLIGNKCTISFATSSMISEFSKITKMISEKKQYEVLQEIANAARRILQSELVLLFLISDNIVQYSDLIYSGDLSNVTVISEGRERNFVDWIIKQNTEVFIKSVADLPKEYNFQNGFLGREKIKSCAAFPLTLRGALIGVMFFNYRTEHQFPQTVQQLAKSFVSLAATAVFNAQNMALIIEQREKLFEKAEKIEFEYSDTLEKMEKMLPVANAKSLADIIRAVNHDIRNHLLKISMNLIDISNNSIQHIRNTTDKNRFLQNIEMVEADVANSTNLIDLFEPNSFNISVESIYDIVLKIQKLFSNYPKKSNTNIEILIEKNKDTIPEIRCVKAEISMIVYNLVLNARKAIIEKCEKNGSKAYCVGKVIIFLDYKVHEKEHIIAVEDDGIGIDKKFQDEEIFRPGYTTRKDGLGIGLYFVRQTVRDMYNGDVMCNSVPNQGTTFTVRMGQHIK